MSEAPKIDTIGPEVLEMQAAARVCRTTFEGIESMREAGETYLPKNPRENPNDYKLRLGLTDFFPALQKAVHVYIGKPLGSPIVVTGSPVEKFLDDVDLQGNDLDTWTRCNLTAGLVDGEVFAVAEYHKVAPGLNLAQERALGARPYLLHILKSMGAQASDIFKLVWLETVLLCLSGGLVGTALAVGTAKATDLLIRGLLPYSPSGGLVSIDARLVLFTLGVITLVGLLSGLYPSWKAGRTRPLDTIRSEEQS